MRPTYKTLRAHSNIVTHAIQDTPLFWGQDDEGIYISFSREEVEEYTKATTIQTVSSGWYTIINTQHTQNIVGVGATQGDCEGMAAFNITVADRHEEHGETATLTQCDAICFLDNTCVPLESLTYPDLISLQGEGGRIQKVWVIIKSDGLCLWAEELDEVVDEYIGWEGLPRHADELMVSASQHLPPEVIDELRWDVHGRLYYNEEDKQELEIEFKKMVDIHSHTPERLPVLRHWKRTQL